MLSKSKKIILTIAILKSILLLPTSDYVDTSFPQKTYIYAPHRESYFLSDDKKEEGKTSRPSGRDVKECFFCRIENNQELQERILLKSFEFHNVALNEYPYNRGHILIAPKRHVALLGDLTLEERVELLHAIDISMQALKAAVNADGFNIGINVGKAGGASIPDHLHIHIVPRYFNECSNQGFTTTTAKATVVSWDLSKLALLLRKHFDLILQEQDTQ